MHKHYETIKLVFHVTAVGYVNCDYKSENVRMLAKNSRLGSDMTECCN